MKASGKIGSSGVWVSDSVEKRFETDTYIYTYIISSLQVTIYMPFHTVAIEQYTFYINSILYSHVQIALTFKQQSQLLFAAHAPP
jgi:hypothetical protein